MITVIIPTYNRVNCIKTLFELCIIKYKGNLFLFEIHDSSETNEIQKLFLKYSKKCNCSIFYYRYRSNTLVDNKAIEAIKKVGTKYFWLLGDGNLVDFNKMEDILLKNRFIDYDVLNIDISQRRGYLGQDKNCIVNIVYEYNNPVEFARKYFSRLTYWGSTIIKVSFYKPILFSNLFNKYIKNEIPWWIACVIFEAINYYKSIGINFKLGTIYTDCLSYNPGKKDHWWTQDEKYYIYVFLKFNKAIELLPKLYNNEKKNIIKFFRNDALVRNTYLLNLRSKGVLNYDSIKKYKKEIIKVDGFYYKMIIFCIIPKRLASWIIKLKSVIKFLLVKVINI